MTTNFIQATLLGDRQLFTPLPNFIAPNHYALGKLVTRVASNIPYIFWPNGEPCQVANLYMLSLLNKRGRRGRQGLALKGKKGGTFGNYASKISQLLRYCCRKNVELMEVSDGFFCEFMQSLREEKKNLNPLLDKKTALSVDEVGRVCLEFLRYAGVFYGNEMFVALEGNIRIEYREVRIKSKSGRLIVKTYLYHHSFSSGSSVKRRDPIPSAHISSLRQAVDELESSRFVNRRRSIMLSLLESIGCRRGELADVLVDDIFAAAEQKEPMLTLTNLKQGDGSQRSVPISKMLLQEVKTYIRYFRRPIIDNKIGLKNDHGYLLISETTGRRLDDNTITSEISTLRKQAKIPEKACPHMFRHAYITRLFITMIQRHRFENEDKFRFALLTWDKFAADIMQWTGHTDVMSLFRYIHIAFAEISGYASIVSSVHLVEVIHAYDSQLDNLITRMLEGPAVELFKDELEKLRMLRNEDISIAYRRAGVPEHAADADGSVSSPD
ncbi:tyrosine-type recombinase/integrase [Pseudomonas graminis]|uniref:Tyr recombinase domain-containing protein n=1 Tax=Pseudomonas graminis TaxID=158627 RepID=A0A1C2EDA6_9PSED|nr:site-specific integrase [Pseudomonas graminis]OCX24831.1 hypothetical protein BBI10_04230 [Pseudomonas graminis]